MEASEPDDRDWALSRVAGARICGFGPRSGTAQADSERPAASREAAATRGIVIVLISTVFIGVRLAPVNGKVY
ncbi:hypothetical protein NTCA1_30220 [Novosphingobium sp. TCA1]|nr:hypothetical protein NTCA1_30220 [Novosphingobium sp. TCA1]